MNLLLCRQNWDLCCKISCTHLRFFLCVRAIVIEMPPAFGNPMPAKGSSSVHVSAPSTETGRRSQKVKLGSCLSFSQCQLANIIDSRVVLLFTTLPSRLWCVYVCMYGSLPSCLLKAEDIWENWNSLVSLTLGAYLELNWWLANIQTIPPHSYLSSPPV